MTNGTTCRICLAKYGSQHLIFDDNEIKERISEKILACFREVTFLFFYKPSSYKFYEISKMLRTKIHIAISAIGVLLGLSAFICFCIIYSNVEAGVWALLSGINAGLALMLHCHYLKESLHVNFSRKALEYIGDLGILGFVSGAGLMLFYIFLQCYYQTDVTPIETSIIIRLVWASMMTKWGLLLYFTTRKYLRTYNDHQLFSENPNIEET